MEKLSQLVEEIVRNLTGCDDSADLPEHTAWDHRIVYQGALKIYDLGLLAGRHAERETGWEPIESAPFNERVLIYVPERENFVHGWFTAVKAKMTGKWVFVAASQYPPTPPTFWRPLPASPGGERRE